MTKVALDVGQARIGLAVSQGSLVLPLESFDNNEAGLTNLYAELDFRNPEVIYVGLPVNLKNQSTTSTEKAIEFARLLAAKGFEIRLIDERLTTKTAQTKAREAGKNSKQSRSFIDALAAAAILEFALSKELDGLAGISIEELDA